MNTSHNKKKPKQALQQVEYNKNFISFLNQNYNVLFTKLTITNIVTHDIFLQKITLKQDFY